MRTTLKRGYGRAAETNGNGRAVLPPGVVTPVTVYQQPPPAQPGVGTLVGKFFLWLFAAALVVAAGLVGGAYLWAHAKVAQTGAHTRDVKKAQAHLAKVPDPTQPANALIIGHDHAAGVGDKPRSDTVMLVRADPRTKTISLLSFPRDLVVPLHCPGMALGSDRINVAYHTCGSTGTIETVKALTGLPISYLISVDFRGFKGVVNHLGGVWVDVDHRYFNNNGGRTYGHLLRDRHQARVPAAVGGKRARVRPLPAHRLRSLSRRAPAGLRQGFARADKELVRPDVGSGAREHAREQHRARARWQAHGQPRSGRAVGALRLPAAARPRVPEPHREPAALRAQRSRAASPTSRISTRRCSSS